MISDKIWHPQHKTINVMNRWPYTAYTTSSYRWSIGIENDMKGRFRSVLSRKKRSLAVIFPRNSPSCSLLWRAHEIHAVHAYKSYGSSNKKGDSILYLNLDDFRMKLFNVCQIIFTEDLRYQISNCIVKINTCLVKVKVSQQSETYQVWRVLKMLFVLLRRRSNKVINNKDNSNIIDDNNNDI